MVTCIKENHSNPSFPSPTHSIPPLPSTHISPIITANSAAEGLLVVLSTEQSKCWWYLHCANPPPLAITGSRGLGLEGSSNQSRENCWGSSGKVKLDQAKRKSECISKSNEVRRGSKERKPSYRWSWFINKRGHYSLWGDFVGWQFRTMCKGQKMK